MLWKDIRYGMRMLIKNPTFTVVAAITLALGIGANTAIFSMIDSLLLRPLPVQRPGELVVLAAEQLGQLQNSFSIADYRDIRSQSTNVFADLVAFQIGMDGLATGGRADRILTNYVSGNYFTMLGVQPALGRLILPSEGVTPGADPVIVLGYRYWKTRFNGDGNILGSKVSIDGHPVTVVGVAPKDFFGTYALVEAQAFLPLGMANLGGVPPDFMVNRNVRFEIVMGRLQRGTTLAQANATLAVIGRRLAEQYPESDKNQELEAYPELRSRPQPNADDAIMISSSLFLGLAVMVLLLACVNVANILLVRASTREREMAIRSALGAARTSLVRQLLTESILLSVTGGIFGLLLGFWGSHSLSTLNIHFDMPVHFGFDFDWRVFTFGFSVALATGIIVGIVPAVRASLGNINRILRASGRGVVSGKSRLRNTLVVLQVAGSLVLLVTAGLFMRSLGQAQRANLGFDASKIVNLTMDPNEIGYKSAQTLAFYKTLLDGVRALPGVESASIATSVPLGYMNNADDLLIPGFETRPGVPAPSSLDVAISAGYLQNLRIPLLKGRDISEADNERAPYVALVNEALAQRFWPGQDPLGRELAIGSDPKHSMRIVGIVGNARQVNVTGPPSPVIYVPFAQHTAMASLETLQVRVAGDPIAALPEIERLTHSLAPALPVFDVRTFREALYTLNGLLIYQVGAGLAAALGMLGLVLAIVGVYGVVSYAAAQQTHDIGVRMALGAQRPDILKMVFRHGLLIVLVGLTVGIGGAFAASKFLANFLLVSATDPLTYSVVSMTLLAVALFASYIPSRRATQVDPMVALRYE